MVFQTEVEGQSPEVSNKVSSRQESDRLPHLMGMQHRQNNSFKKTNKIEARNLNAKRDASIEGKGYSSQLANRGSEYGS